MVSFFYFPILDIIINTTKKCNDMENNIDTYLIFEDDARILGANNTAYQDTFGVFGVGQDANGQLAVGPNIEAQLQSLGRGFTTSVTDFGTEIVVKVKYNNVKTGQSASATFLIKFTTPKTGVVKASTVRQRSFTSHSEAIQYIRARANALKQKTQSNG